MIGRIGLFLSNDAGNSWRTIKQFDRSYDPSCFILDKHSQGSGLNFIERNNLSIEVYQFQDYGNHVKLTSTIPLNTFDTMVELLGQDEDSNAIYIQIENFPDI